MMGIRQEGGWARQREKDFWGEREQHSSEWKWRGLILTVGLNQHHLQTLNTWEFLEGNNKKTMDGLDVNQTLGGVQHSLAKLA